MQRDRVGGCLVVTSLTAPASRRRPTPLISAAAQLLLPPLLPEVLTLLLPPPPPLILLPPHPPDRCSVMQESRASRGLEQIAELMVQGKFKVHFDK